MLGYNSGRILEDIVLLKKSIASFLTFCIFFCSTACAQAKPFVVTATFYPLYLALINITKDVPGVETACMAPPQAGCLHEYQMTTADRRLLSDSDLIIRNGAGLEGFLEMLMPELQGRLVDASAGIALLQENHGDENPHVWVSISGMMDEVRNIAEGLAQADPIHASQYEENAQAYLERLEALKAELETMLAPVSGQPIVTFHAAFAYWADEFNIRVVATVESEHGGAPSGKEMAQLAEVIRSEGVRALFAEPQYGDESVNILSNETGVPVYTLDPIVSGEVNPTDYDAYERIVLTNAKTLLEALR